MLACPRTWCALRVGSRRLKVAWRLRNAEDTCSYRELAIDQGRDDVVIVIVLSLKRERRVYVLSRRSVSHMINVEGNAEYR
jgi:hypothetical protein